jgi:outer membrane receptor protein involved in Fe transport
MVEKIEVNTNPGAKYDADVDAVINIVLKKNSENGLNGRINLETPTAKRFFTNNNINIDYYNKGTHFFLAGWAGGSRWDLEQNTNRITNSGLADETRLTQTANGKTQNKYGGFSYGVDWFLNDNNILNLYSSLRPRMNSFDEFSSDNNFISNSSNSSTNVTTKNNYSNFFNDYSLFYKHKFNKKDHEFSIESYYSKGNNNNSLNYYEKPYVGNELSEMYTNQRLQETENFRNQFIFKSDYTLPLTDKIKLSVGYNYNNRKLENNYTETISAVSNQLVMNENRHSAYGNVSLTIKGINVQTGVRYEYSDFRITQVRDTTNNYDCFLPFASVQFKLGKINNFKFNYRKSIQRPELGQLSPFGNQGDAYSLSIGNPNLTPGYVNKIEFTHRIQLSNPITLSYRPYWTFVNNGIQQVSFVSSDSIVTQKYSNVGKESEYGITFSGNFNLLKWWSFNPNVTIFQKDIKEKVMYAIPARSKSSVRLNISSQFILPKDYVIFVEYSYGSPVLGQQTVTERNYEFVTGFQKKINNRLNITVLTINPWTNTYLVNKNTTKTSSMDLQSKLLVHYPYVFNIRLSYTFSKGKEGKKLNREREQDNDAGGKKGIL